MRLQLLTPLLFMPALCDAQSAKPAYRNEIVLNLGTSTNVGYERAGHGLDWKAPKRGSIGLLRNNGALQYGLQLEAGSESAEHWYLAPSLTGNYCVRYRRGYGYAGITAGYFLNRNSYDLSYLESQYAHGYQVGVQTGYVYNVGSRFAFAGEIAFRHLIRWREEFEYDDVSVPYPPYYEIIAISRGKVPQTDVMIPVTLGIRYKL